VGELRYILGGPQGGGLETTSEVLSWSFAKSGYGILSDREYFSNIKGRHSYVHATVSGAENPFHLSYPVDLVGAMDAETVFTHFQEIDRGGYLIYNKDEDNAKYGSILSMEPELKTRLNEFFKANGIGGTLGELSTYLSERRQINVVALSYSSLLRALQQEASVIAAQASRYVSSILIGSIASLVGLESSSLAFGLKKRFRSGEILKHNMIFSEIIARQLQAFSYKRPSLGKSSLSRGKMVVASGNDFVAMAKLMGGVRFQSYYPITPAADESFTLEKYEKVGGDRGSIVVFQTEDEIAAVTSAIGASLTGTRSASATSGPGFDLMTEGLGWAGINETPILVTYYQRGGPSTGQPTRGGQSDLLSSVFASHGEFPRIVLSSGDHSEAFWDTVDALNYAEMFQTPVIHLVDKFLANSIASIPLPDVSKIEVRRGNLVKNGGDGYQRFDFTSSISPRAFIGDERMWYTGDEHNENGHIDEDSENRIKMMTKRMDKMNLIEESIPEERRHALYGDKDPEIVLLGWGFVKGVAIKALEQLRNEGIKASYFHIRTFVPFPKKSVESIFEDVGPENVVDVECNYEGQAGILVRLNTGHELRKHVVKFTGRPIYLSELVEAIRRVLSGSSKEVLNLGA
jgi:2-oxoglutarate ferredoxin oxidoreductase subunit alpha